MLVYDSHCHFGSVSQPPPQFALIPGINIQDIPNLITLKQKYPQYKIGFGIHPWHISNIDEITQLTNYIKRFKPDFIGEIGLDYLKPKPELQRELFTIQLKIAKEFNLPVIVHCVQAYNDVLMVLKQQKISCGIIHAFNANANIARQFTDLGFLLGIGSIITHHSKLSTSINSIDLSHLVFESDAPFMPAFNRDKSLSQDTFLYAQIAARKLDMNLIDLIQCANSNLVHLFRN